MILAGLDSVGDSNSVSNKMLLFVVDEVMLFLGHQLSQCSPLPPSLT